jgi:hypothetical protein
MLAAAAATCGNVRLRLQERQSKRPNQQNQQQTGKRPAHEQGLYYITKACDLVGVRRLVPADCVGRKLGVGGQPARHYNTSIISELGKVDAI